ncbi:MAG: hypothetical protein ACRYHQ_35210, partial [Janthinobacterium lividum]
DDLDRCDPLRLRRSGNRSSRSLTRQQGANLSKIASDKLLKVRLGELDIILVRGGDALRAFGAKYPHSWVRIGPEPAMQCACVRKQTGIPR